MAKPPELFRDGYGQDRVGSNRGDVKATAQATGVVRESKTDDTGHYLMPLLPIGDYTIRVDSPGFGPAEQTGRAAASG